MGHEGQPPPIITRLLEQIRFPVNKLLWQQIAASPRIIEFLGEDKGIVLVGTDSNLSLLKAIGQRPNPITIIERNPKVIDGTDIIATENNATAKVLIKDFFYVKPEDLATVGNQSPGLVVAKHIGFFANVALLVLHAQNLMPEGGYVVVSDPISATPKTLIELEKDRAEFNRRGIEWQTSVFGNSIDTLSSLFIFRIPQFNQVSIEPKVIRARVFAKGLPSLHTKPAPADLLF